MDNETSEFLENMMNQINSRFDVIENNIGGIENKISGIENNIGGIENKVSGIENKISGLEKGQREIKDIIVELESKNASRHLELKESIDKLRRDLSTVEEVTAKNWTDIIELKKAK